MSSVRDNLARILTAVYGRDVRQAIHDAIEDCWNATSADLEGEFFLQPFHVAGTVTNDGKDICFLIPFREANTRRLRISGSTEETITVRDRGTILANQETYRDNIIFMSDLAPSVIGLNVTARKTSGTWGAVNESIVSVEFSCTLSVGD